MYLKAEPGLSLPCCRREAATELGMLRDEGQVRCVDDKLQTDWQVGRKRKEGKREETDKNRLMKSNERGRKRRREKGRKQQLEVTSSQKAEFPTSQPKAKHNARLPARVRLLGVSATLASHGCSRSSVDADATADCACAKGRFNFICRKRRLQAPSANKVRGWAMASHWGGSQHRRYSGQGEEFTLSYRVKKGAERLTLNLLCSAQVKRIMALSRSKQKEYRFQSIGNVAKSTVLHAVALSP